MAADELGVNDDAQQNPTPYPTMIAGAPWQAPFLDPEYGNPSTPFPFEGWLAWHYACYLRPRVEAEGTVDPVCDGSNSPPPGT